MQQNSNSDSHSDDSSLENSLPEQTAASSFRGEDTLENRRSPLFRALQEQILAHVESPKYRAVKPKVILKQLGLPLEQEEAVKKAIKFLVKEGRLAYGTQHLVYPLIAGELGDAKLAPPPQEKPKEKTIVRETQRPAKTLAPLVDKEMINTNNPVEEDRPQPPKSLPEIIESPAAKLEEPIVKRESLKPKIVANIDDPTIFDALEAALNDTTFVKNAVAALAKTDRKRLQKLTPQEKAQRAAEKRAAAAEEKKAEKLAANCVKGRLRKSASGTGFVRPEGTPLTAGRDLDILIPARDTLDAIDGDLVSVRLARRTEPRVTGEIVEVLERKTHRFVGTYEERRGFGYAVIDGRAFSDPVSVGDASAKRAAVGDKVVVEIVKFPRGHTIGEGVVVEVLGARGAPGVDTQSIIREFDLPGDFPEDVLASAREQGEKFNEEIGDRTDFTNDVVITIDPVDARDFDDAISLRREANGHWVLGAHIADVSHFVPENSPLDREARERATSIYLPDRVIPMLPESISNHLASLQPDRVRYVQTCVVEFTAEGIPVSAQVYRGAIKSRRRFTYEEVDEFLADRQAWREKLSPEVWELLSRMHEFAMLLRKRRFRRGSLELSLPETKIDLDSEGRVAGAHATVNTESHQIIEEFMLAANEATARLLSEREVPFLRRVHESPDPRKLQTLTRFVRELGIPCESLESRFEIQRVVNEAGASPLSHAVNYAILRSMQKAVYSVDPIGHYALKSDHYCHFTSPIRRYPDLTVHRMFNAIAEGRKPNEDRAKQVQLAEHCSEREQRAAKAERELTKLKLLDYMSRKIGTKLQAVVTGVEEFGLFAQGTEIPAEGLIRVQSLDRDFYHFDRDTHSLVGRRGGNAFRLGDLLEVEVARVDLDRRELDFRVISIVRSASPPPRREERREARREGRPARPERDARAARPRGGNREENRRPRDGERRPASNRFGDRRPAGGNRKTFGSQQRPAVEMNGPAPFPAPQADENGKLVRPPKRKRKQRLGKKERAEKKRRNGGG